MIKFFEEYLSKNRKFKLTLLYFITVTIMLIIGKIGEETYLQFLLYSLGIFAGANAMQKLKFGGYHKHDHVQIPPFSPQRQEYEKQQGKQFDLEE